MIKKMFLVGILVLMVIVSSSSFPRDDLVKQSSVSVSITPTKFPWDAEKVVLFSWDDARRADVYLSKVDDARGIKHTIVAPSFDSYPTRDFYRYMFLLDELFRGHDVQSHSGKHVRLSSHSKADQETLIRWGRDGIFRLYGFTPLMMAYPFGDIGGNLIVPRYFDLGRTISAENGTWYPLVPRLTGTSISGHGIDDTNVMEIPSIVDELGRGEVFKGYGHVGLPLENGTKAFSFRQGLHSRLPDAAEAGGVPRGLTDLEKYDRVLDELSSRTGVWITTWGELIAYTKVIESLVIHGVQVTSSTISFDINWNVDVSKYGGIDVTLRVTGAPFKGSIAMIDGKLSNSVRNEGSGEMLITLRAGMNGVASSHVIIYRNSFVVEDHTSPRVLNLRVTEWNVFESDSPNPRNLTFVVVRMEIHDDSSFVGDVKMEITLKNGTRLSYEVMETPTFWNNETWGRVLFNFNQIDADTAMARWVDDASLIKEIRVMASDVLGNMRDVTFTTWKVIKKVGTSLTVPNELKTCN